MKIFILRHEDRPQDCSFFSPLTKVGLENSVKLIELLDKCNINLIFSSPFIRTLQTIYPFASSKNLYVNVDYSLSELHHPDLIPKQAVGMSLPEYLAESFKVNPESISKIKPNEIVYPETQKDLELRVRRFFKDLMTKYHKSNYNIVVVTHKAVCAVILNIIARINDDLRNSILSPEFIEGYDKGKLSLIWDTNKWTFKQLN